MNAVRKFICVPEENRKLGQATFTDFHKIKVILRGPRRQRHLNVYDFAWWFYGCRYSFADNFRSVIRLCHTLTAYHSHKSRSRLAIKQRLWLLK